MSEVDKLKHTVGKRLLIWGILSVVIGVVLSFGSPGTILGGIGLQAIIWGGIDFVIAASIIFKQKEQSSTKIAETVSKSMTLDIIFIVVGLIVTFVYLQDPYFLGNGIGVTIQGIFLRVLDQTYYDSLMKLETEPEDSSN